MAWLLQECHDRLETTLSLGDLSSISLHDHGNNTMSNHLSAEEIPSTFYFLTDFLVAQITGMVREDNHLFL